MADKMISDLDLATGLFPTDKFELEQATEIESTHVTVAMLLGHINTELVVPVTVTMTTLDGRVTTLEADLTAEVLARTNLTDEVHAARGTFPDLDSRLDDLAINAGKVASVFGRTGSIVAVTGDYTPEQVGAAPTIHDHDAADITTGVLVIERGGTNGEGFRFIEALTAPAGQPEGTRWLDLTDGTEYTLGDSGWVQWAGGQPIQGMQGNGATTWGVITGAIADQTDLKNALATKAGVVHSHVMGDVTGLNDALATKANVADLTAKANTAGQVFTGDVTAPNVSDTNGNVRHLLPITANVATTLSTTHLNKVIEKATNTAYTYTIAPTLGNQGDVITVINSGTAGDVTIARGAGVALYRAGVDGNIIVGPGSMATIYRSATANRWIA